MAAYLEKKKRNFIKSFPSFVIEMIPRAKTYHSDALTKLASTKDAELLDAVSVEFLAEPSINQRPMVMVLDQGPSWMDPIFSYLKLGELLEDKTETKLLRIKAAHCVIYDDKLYKRGYSMSLLRCVTPSKANYIMREI